MIRLEGDPVLKQPCRDFDFDDDFPRLLAERLYRAMMAERGAGLAAPQLGQAVRAFVIRRAGGWTACFNPKINERSATEVTEPEGCLSYPGIFVRVPRAISVDVQYQGIEGKWITGRYEGLEARAFQHELDHLTGRTLPDMVAAQAFQNARARALAKARPRSS